MEVKIDERKEKKILRIKGRIDANTAVKLESILDEIELVDGKNVLMDFSHVDYLSSAGMRLILSFLKKLKSFNAYLILFNVHEDVMSIISMAGFKNIIPICQSEAEALDKQI